jgi:16S rRNA processing protein RimM
MPEDFISIGKIVNTHGHRGEVRVLPLTDFPERFIETDRVQVSTAAGRITLAIENARPHQKFFVVKFKEVQDMNAALALKGGLLQITRDELMELPEGTFYIFDIVGLSVYDSAGAFLGKVSDIIKTGANDVYVVETGSKPILVPALKQVVKEINLAGQRMVVELPEGL